VAVLFFNPDGDSFFASVSLVSLIGYQVVQPFVFYSWVDPQFVGILGGRDVFRHADDCLFVAIFLPWKMQGISLTQHLTALVYILAYSRPVCVTLFSQGSYGFLRSINFEPAEIFSPDRVTPFFQAALCRILKWFASPSKRRIFKLLVKLLPKYFQHGFFQ
jgi:hypothetical protein